MTQNNDAPDNNHQNSSEQPEKINLERDGEAPARGDGEAPARGDRFELLSAYLDGEVTAAERKEVQLWLENDPKAQQLYRRLLRLRDVIHNIPLPQAEQSASQLSDLVFQKIDQRRQKKQVYIWGTGAIAAVFIGALSSVLSGGNSPIVQMAQSLFNQNSETLIIALNRPAVQIPPSPDLFPHISPRPVK